MQYPTKKALTAFLTTLLMTSSFSVSAQELNKVPDLTKDFNITAPTQAVAMPASYPEELNHLTPDIRSYVVIDQATNNILMEREGNTPYPIASMSKVMPVYLTYKAIEEGKIKLEDKIKVTAAIYNDFTINPEMSSAYLVQDAEYTVQELLYGILLASGNDATTLLMEKIYGSEQEAVKAIRAQLEEWGIDAEFYTTSGINVKYLPERYWIEGATASSQNKMSAANVALMAQYVVEKYPQILEITSSPSFIMLKGKENEYTIENPNLLLPGRQYARLQATGLKSGYTEEAGRCFITTVTQDDRALIAVVMGIQNPYNSYEETGILLDGLHKYPELYKLEGFASNKVPTKAEKEAEAASLAAEEAAKKAAEVDETDDTPTVNRRHSPFTDFMRSIFGIFK